ncbi:MAG TPA: transposase [bacterium]|nr:transposase [bacterium]
MRKVRRPWRPNSTWHLYNRGNGGRAIVRSPNDYALFVDLLRRALESCNAVCLAFAVMLNHFHLVVRTRNVSTSRLMNSIEGRYSRAVNERWGEKDHLWGPRFGAKLIHDDEYLRRAIAYVNANPIAAGIVPDLNALAVYPWTSYSSIVGRKQPGIIEPSLVLAPFGNDRDAALANLRAEIEHSVGIAEELEREFDVSDFLEVHEPASLDGHASNEELLKRLRLTAPDPEAMLEEVCERLGVDANAVRAGVRTHRISAARAVIAWVGVFGYFSTQSWMARLMGVGSSAIGEGVARGAALADRLLCE